MATTLLGACGGNASNSAATLQGVFLDAAVEGLEYSTASNTSKIPTTTHGGFSCRSNETISFALGGVVLGSAPCSTTITPLTLVGTTDVENNGVLDRALFLQTLDEDRDSFNGMKLTAEVRTALVGRLLDFSAAPAAFNTSLTTLLAVLPAPCKSG